MKYDFDTPVERKGFSNLKENMSEKTVIEAGNVSFCAGEMDFKTAPAIEKMTLKLARNGLYGYTVCDDTYRNQVCNWMQEQRGFQLQQEWIVPTLGTIHSLATAIRLLTVEGEEILVNTPFYSRYEQAARRLHRQTVKSPMLVIEGRYRLDFADMEERIRSGNIKLFVFSNPCNPTGQIYEEEELVKLKALMKKYKVSVFCDEIFAETVYGGRRVMSYCEIAGVEGTLVATSMGKSFNLTGANHANIIIPDEKLREEFIQQRNADHYGSIDPWIYSALRGAYSTEGADWLRQMNTYVEENIRMIKAFFEKELPEVKVYGGEGAYILWMDWSSLFPTAEKLFDFLIYKAYLDLDPGNHYGEEYACYTRMCVASPRYLIEKALVMLKKAVETIRQQGKQNPLFMDA